MIYFWEISILGATQKLVQEIVKAKYEDIPLAASERVKRAIFDDIGIAFLGYLMIGKPLVGYAKEFKGTPESTIIGDGTKVSCAVAAGVNAQMSGNTNFQETGPGLHAMSSIAETGISVGELVGASGKDIITAVALGYEMNGRFDGAAFPPERLGFTGTLRHLPLTTTITAAKLLCLDETQINNAIGIAWFFPPVSPEFVYRNTCWRGIGLFNLGHCQLGIQAALLAQKGFNGPTDVFDKEFFYDLGRLVSSPSPYYYPANELHLKTWITTQLNHQGIQAALEIIKEEEIKPDEIEEIKFKGMKLYFQFPFNTPEPTEYWEAIYSIPWAFAMAISGYDAGPEWFTEERFKDPACLDLAKKVKIGEDLLASKIYFGGKVVSSEHPNEVEITAKGKCYKKRKVLGETTGSPTRPMTKEQLEKKFKTQTKTVIGENQTEELIKMLTRLEQEDIRDIAKLFKPI